MTPDFVKAGVDIGAVGECGRPVVSLVQDFITSLLVVWDSVLSHGVLKLLGEGCSHGVAAIDVGKEVESKDLEQVTSGKVSGTVISGGANSNKLVILAQVVESLVHVRRVHVDLIPGDIGSGCEKVGEHIN